MSERRLTPEQEQAIEEFRQTGEHLTCPEALLRAAYGPHVGTLLHEIGALRQERDEAYGRGLDDAWDLIFGEHLVAPEDWQEQGRQMKERAAALEQVWLACFGYPIQDDWRVTLETENEYRLSMSSHISQLTKERDEARADLMDLWGWVFGSEPPPDDWKEVMLERGAEIYAARQEYSSLQWRKCFLEAERTIREFCEALLGPMPDAIWHQGTRPEMPEAENLTVRAGQKIEKLKRERDEARAALKFQWSDQPPVEPGFYWWRAGPEHTAATLCVCEAWAGSPLLVLYGGGPRRVIEMGGQWAGPLVPPEGGEG